MIIKKRLISTWSQCCNKCYRIREAGGENIFEKGQYITYGIREVYEVMGITTIDRSGGSQGKLYCVLRPYYYQDSKTVTPVDSNKTVIKPFPTQEEALELIDRIQDTQEMEVTEDRQREEQYKEVLKTCDYRVWVNAIKVLYPRRKDRIEREEKMTDLDKRYFKTIEENLYSELVLSLGMSRDEMVDYIKGRVLVEASAVG